MPKIITSISLFIFFTVLVSLLTAGLIYNQNNLLLSKNLLTATTTDSAGAATVNKINDTLLLGKTFTLNLAEISKHNSISDCWLLVNNKVYDVTTSITAHPGGAGTLIPSCGKEATAAFNTKNTGQPHSTSASAMLADYFIGNLNQVFGTPIVKKPVTTSIPPNTPASVISTPVDVSLTSPNTSVSTVLTSAEVAKHSSQGDCWLIINNKIYNVTNYLTAHPGGVSAITPYCGRDGTIAFDSKGSNGHSSFASSLLTQYFIGNLNQAVSTSQIEQSVQSTNSITPVRTDDDDDEDEENDD